MKPLKLNMLTFDSIVKQCDRPAFVVFGAVYNSDCRALFYKLPEYAKKLDKRMYFAIADIDVVLEYFYEYEVVNMPTTIIFEDGKPYARVEGPLRYEDIDRMIYNFFGYLPYYQSITIRGENRVDKRQDLY